MSTTNDRMPITAATWTKKASTLWTHPIEKLAPPPGVPAQRNVSRLPATIVESSNAVSEAGALSQEMLRRVEWDIVPPLAATERTAWIPLDTPIAVDSNAMPAIRGLKLKGVGLGGLFGALQPSSEKYEDELAHGHIGLTQEGEFIVLKTPPAPTGAMFLSRAFAEFRNAEILMKAGCPSIVPIAVYRYDTLRCEWKDNENFGAVLCGGPTKTRLRGSGLFIAEPEEDTEQGIACDTLLRTFGFDRITAITAIAYECGRTLRDFHTAGLYQYNGFPTNYIIDLDSRRVCLVDLDSSKSLCTCNPRLRALEILRDLAGWLFNMGIAFFEPSVAARFVPSKIASGLHFRRIVDGYFSDVDAKTDDALREFLDHFIERYQNVFRLRDEIATSPDGESLLNRLWINRAFCYTSCMADLASIYSRSEMARRYPLEYTTAELRERADRFLATGPQTRW